jgi:hypothetical protein
MTAISCLTASETYLSAFSFSETAVSPKLYGLDQPDEKRQKTYYGNALPVPPGLPQTGWS